MTTENQQLSPEQQEQLHMLQMFIINNKDRVEQWAKAHSKEPGVANNPPIYWDATTRRYYWANRKARRQK